MSETIRVMISSTARDLPEHREKVMDACMRLGVFPDRENLYETAALNCWNRASGAADVNRFAYALDLYACAEKLYEHLVKELNQRDLLNKYAAMLNNKGLMLGNLTRLAEALTEDGKAIAIRERLVYQEQQTHLTNDLANVYMNKGIALWSLTRLTEALAEYDKAIAIWERLVYQEQQTHRANYLAMAYMNKGNALLSLTELADSLAEYDKAIAIRERLVKQEQQAHLANDLASTYLNKALALEKQSNFEEALVCYEMAIQGKTFCVEHRNIFWVMPNLLKILRRRLVTLLQLERWPPAAADVTRFSALITSYTEREDIDEGLKEAAIKEFGQMISRLRDLDPEQRELLYAELGDEAEAVRSLVDYEDPSG